MASTILTVKPDEILCLAQLLKRWPYLSSERVCFQVWDIVDATRGAAEESNLDIYLFDGIQRNQIGEIFIDLVCDLLQKEDSESYYERCGDIFFLKQQVEDIEKEHNEYLLFPDKVDMPAGTIYCDENKLPLVAKRAIYALCHRPFNKKLSFSADFKIPKDELYPWLGPIKPDVSKFGSHSKPDQEFDHFLVTRFLEAARTLGHNNNDDDKKILAQMVAYRYPNLTWEQLARHVDGVAIEKSRTPQVMRTWQSRGKALLKTS